MPTAPARKRRKGTSSLDGLYAKGEFQRDALEATRTATGPVSAHGIARDLAARKGLDLGAYEVLVNGTADAEGRQTYATAG